MAYISASDRPPVARRARTPGGVRNFLELVGAALRVAGAVESRQRPSANDLIRLGIKPSAFPHL